MNTTEINKWLELFEIEQSGDESALLEVLTEAIRLIADLQARVAALEAQSHAH
ncbi:MAG: hypothetical protein JNL34_17075 [Anaerolineae bacterium]|nr:hypothetical protein [Anaerolineae bacterium]